MCFRSVGGYIYCFRRFFFVSVVQYKNKPHKKRDYNVKQSYVVKFGVFLTGWFWSLLLMWLQTPSSSFLFIFLENAIIARLKTFLMKWWKRGINIYLYSLMTKTCYLFQNIVQVFLLLWMNCNIYFLSINDNSLIHITSSNYNFKSMRGRTKASTLIFYIRANLSVTVSRLVYNVIMIPISKLLIHRGFSY